MSGSPPLLSVRLYSGGRTSERLSLNVTLYSSDTEKSRRAKNGAEERLLLRAAYRERPESSTLE